MCLKLEVKTYVNIAKKEHFDKMYLKIQYYFLKNIIVRTLKYFIT